MSELSLPPQLKPIGHFLKIANEHTNRDPVISYWARFHAVQIGLLIDKDSPQAKKVLFGLLDTLEAQKKGLTGNEAITNEMAAEAHIENYTIKLFKWADEQDKSSIYNKNVVKAFYSAGILFDVLTNFQKELSDDLEKLRKYAKWRAAYIHNCLRNGENPLPAPGEYEEPGENADYGGDQGRSEEGGSNSGGAGSNLGWNQSDLPLPQEPCFQPRPQQPPPPNSHMPQFPQMPQSPHQNTSTLPQEIPRVSPTKSTSSTTSLPVEAISKAQKYCKFAANALNFDDTGTAIENLRKALNLLETGKE